MARLVFVAVLVVLCAIVAVSESATYKEASAGKLISALRAKMAEKKSKDALESETTKRRKSTLALKRKAFELKKAAKSVAKKNEVEGVQTAESVTVGTDVLSGVLQNGKKRGLKLSTKTKKGSDKKSYREVFMVGDFLLSVIGGFESAPCTVGMKAFADMAAKVDWDEIDWTTLHEDDVEPYVFAFIEWWTENKCSEFFLTEYSFYNYVWSIFWDDLEETECYYQLPQDDDGSVDWTSAFDKVNSLDPQAWENYPEPQTECELFEMIGEIYFDFFFAFFFEALPDNILEEIYNDYEVNDLIDPYFGYEHFEGSKK